MLQQVEHFRVGYAFESKKVKSIIKPSLIDHAKSRGIDLIQIDTTKPLIEQGPFNCIVHKLYGNEWKNQLQEFSSKNPNVVVIDPLDAIEKLHNRISMLEVVNQLKMPQGNETLGIPKQIVIYESESLSDLVLLQGLGFPLIAKPLAANGSAMSHKMSLVFNDDGLKELEPPIVLQEFVNHGGVIFKVYVAGKHIKCVKRRSLPDISEEKLGLSGGLLSFSQISNLASEDGSDDSVAKAVEEAKMPLLSFVSEVANGLRQALRLHLFNFDMIRDSRDGNRYLVIDINYFPGYAKMPSYETILTDFFLDIAHPEAKREY